MPFDLAAVRGAIARGLPSRALWTVDNTPLAYDFSAGHGGLESIEAVAATDGFALEDDWFDLLVFGESDYAEGGGATPFLVVRGRDGLVCGLDLERDDRPVFPINSTIDHFIDTFSFLDMFLGAGQRLPSTCEDAVRGIDPDIYEHSEWRDLVRHQLAAQE